MVSSVEGKKATLTTTSVYHSSSFTGFICLPGFSKLVSLLSGWRAPTFLLIAPFPYSSSSCSPLSAYNLWGIIWLWPQFCGWLDLVLPQPKRCGVTSHLQRRRTFMDRKRTERCVCRHCICKKKQEAISVCVSVSHCDVVSCGSARVYQRPWQLVSSCSGKLFESPLQCSLCELLVFTISWKSPIMTEKVVQALLHSEHVLKQGHHFLLEEKHMLPKSSDGRCQEKQNAMTYILFITYI